MKTHSKEKLESALRNAHAAGDEAAARAIAGRLKAMRNTPVTEAEQPTTSLMGMQVPDYMLERAAEFDEQYKENERDLLKDTSQFFNSAANAVGAGVPGMAERYLGGAVDAAASAARGNPDEMSFMDFVSRVGDEQKARQNESPVADLLGTVAGSVGGAMLGGNAVAEMAEQGVPLAGKAVGSWLGRTGTAALGGGAQNAGIALGRGDVKGVGDLIGEGITGALFGAGGQLLGEGVNAVARGVGNVLPGRLGKAAKTTQAKKDVATSFLEGRPGRGSAAAYLRGGKPFTPQELLDTAGNVGGPEGTMFAEALNDPRALKMLETFAGKPSTTGMTNDLAETALSRQTARQQAAPQILLDSLSGAVDAPKPTAQTDAFKEIFDSPSGSGAVVVSKKDMSNALKNSGLLDPTNRAGASARMRRTLKAQIQDVAGKKAEGLTLKGLQNLKIQLDDMIDWSPNSSSADKLSAMDAINLKNFVNDTIKGLDDRYASAAGQFADAKAAEKLAKKGASLIGGTNNTAPINEISAYLQSLDAGELQQVRRGAAQWLEGQVKQNPNALRKLAQENPAFMERMELVLGDVMKANGTTLPEVAEAVGRNLDEAQLYGGINRASMNQAQYTGGLNTEQIRELQGITDLLRVGADTTNNLIGGGMMGSFRRLASRGPEIFEREMLGLLQQSDPAKATSLVNELIALLNQPNATMRPGIGGMGVGAGLSTLLDE